jgi:hypothetical protein
MRTAILNFVEICVRRQGLIRAFFIGMLANHLSNDSIAFAVVASVFLMAPYFPLFIKLYDMLRQEYRGEL